MRSKGGYGGIRDDVVEYCETCSLWLLATLRPITPTTWTR